MKTEKICKIQNNCLAARQAHQGQPDEAGGRDDEEGDDDRFHLVLQPIGDQAQGDAHLFVSFCNF